MERKEVTTKYSLSEGWQKFDMCGVAARAGGHLMVSGL